MGSALRDKWASRLSNLDGKLGHNIAPRITEKARA
jgi:hypothetical protein